MTKEIKEISDEAIKIMKDYPDVTIIGAVEKAKEVMNYEDIFKMEKTN